MRAYAEHLGERDIVVACSMKSGTYMTLQAVYQIAWRGKGEFAHIHNVVPDPEANVWTNDIPLADLHAPFNESPTGYGVVKSHISAPNFDKNALNDPENTAPALAPLRTQVAPEVVSRAKFVTCMRDPKEVLLTAEAYYVRLFLNGSSRLNKYGYKI